MHLTNKNTCAPTPPMGWNSYDYYDTTVDEAAVKANADYMAKHLKAYGWEYIVVDIQWYAKKAGSMRDRYQYIPFSELEMDEYSRLLPDPERFPSSADGSGFKPLADYVHSLGLKFGIHIMRGIPRIAAHHHGKIKNSSLGAEHVADPTVICGWNPDIFRKDSFTMIPCWSSTLPGVLITLNAMISVIPTCTKIRLQLRMRSRCSRMPSKNADGRSSSLCLRDLRS